MHAHRPLAFARLGHLKSLTPQRLENFHLSAPLLKAPKMPPGDFLLTTGPGSYLN